MLIMADMDLGLKIPDTHLLSILKELLIFIAEVGKDPITPTLTPITQVTMVYCCVYLLLFNSFNSSLDDNLRIGSRGYYGRGRSISQDISHSYFYNVLKVGMCLIPDLFSPIIQLMYVDCWGSPLVVMREVYIGIIPDYFYHITLVYHTLYTQCPLKKLLQCVCKDKN